MAEAPSEPKEGRDFSELSVRIFGLGLDTS